MNKNIERATWENTIDEYKAENLTIAEIVVGIFGVLFLISLVGSLIWGNEGFVYLLASFF